MFGIVARKKKPTLREERDEALKLVAEMRVKLAEISAQHKALVAGSTFWKDQAIQYANQIEWWQKEHRKVLERIAAEAESVEFRKYVEEIRAEILRSRPEPSAVAALIAMSKSDTQGAYTPQRREVSVLEALNYGELK